MKDAGSVVTELLSGKELSDSHFSSMITIECSLSFVVFSSLDFLLNNGKKSA